MSSLVPYRYAVNAQLDNVFDKLFQEIWTSPGFMFERNWKPTSINYDEKQYTIEIELPRVKKDQVKVEAVDGVLNISVKTDKMSFSRSFSYSDMDVENSNVELADGILTITVPKFASKTKQIQIK